MRLPPLPGPATEMNHTWSVAFKIGCHWSLRLKEPIAPIVESIVTTDITPDLKRPGSVIGSALVQYNRGPVSNPGRDVLFFFALFVGYIFII